MEEYVLLECFRFVFFYFYFSKNSTEGKISGNFD